VKALQATGLALLATLLSIGATSQDSHDTYMPGAIVTLAVQVEAPAEWALNPDVPLRVSIDPDVIHRQVVKVDKPIWDFKVNGHDATYVAQLPVKISPKYTESKLEIPLALACGICTEDQSRCTFVDEKVKVSLKVVGKGGPGGPAKKGRYLSKCALIPPD
jgi:hypothetical protein